MTTTEQQIKDIETRWWDLVRIRQQHYSLVLNEVNSSQHLAVIEELNGRMEYEQQFDAMEAHLRELDPSHEFLAENQIPV